jgi:hypothetical protein
LWHYLLMACSAKGDYVEAIKAFDSVLEGVGDKSPSEVDSRRWLYLSQAHIKKGEYDNGVKAFMMTVKGPWHFDRSWPIIDNCWQEGNYDAAIKISGMVTDLQREQRLL